MSVQQPFYRLVENIVRQHDLELSRAALRHIGRQVLTEVDDISQDNLKKLQDTEPEKLEKALMHGFDDLRESEKASVILTSYVTQHILQVLSAGPDPKLVDVVDCSEIKSKDTFIIIPDMKEELGPHRCMRVINQVEEDTKQKETTKRLMLKEKLRLRSWTIKATFMFLAGAVFLIALGLIFPVTRHLIIDGLLPHIFVGTKALLDVIFFTA